MTKGTILYVGNYELPDKNAAAHRVRANGKIFSRLGYNTVFLGCVRNGDYFDGVRVSSYDENIYEEAYPRSSKQWFSHLVNTDNILSVISKYEDIKAVILYNLPLVTVKKVKKALKSTGIKVCYDCTEWNSYAEGSLIKRYYKKIDAFSIRKRLGNSVDGLIVISDLMQKQYSECNAIVKIPPLVDRDDGIWHQEKVIHNGFEFMFAGTVSNKESLDKIAEAVSESDRNDVYIRIVGITEEQFVLKYPDCKFDREKLIFSGELSHKDTVKYVLSCDAYIFVREKTLRNNAGFPTKFAESYTCGVPIITTDVSDIKSYVKDDDTICILESTDKSEIIKAMSHFVECSNNMITRNIDIFDYRSYINDVNDWLEKVLL